MGRGIANGQGYRSRAGVASAPHGVSSHRHLYEVINALESETSDSELAVLFASAGDLHINFYENRYSSNNIRHLLQQVGQFLDKAEGLLGVTA